MRMKQCENGHFYDAAKHERCPYCVSLQQGRGAGESVTVSLEGTDAQGWKDDSTVSIIQKHAGADPVVGWLVCLEGKHKGDDFRLHSDNNFIGRDGSMDVPLTWDDTVSRKNHAMLTFDSLAVKFLLAPGEGRSIIRHNGQVVMGPVELKALDRIEIGETKLLFVPLCGEAFQWSK